MSAIAEAASVLLARGPGSPEVYLVERAAALRFMGGFFAFPGGKVGDEDRGFAVPPRAVACVRELFEETGVLLARHADGSYPRGDHLPSLRRDLLDERLTFAELLGRLGLLLDPRDLTPAGSLVTPAFSAARFDTEFFVADLPPGQEAEVWPGELASGAWSSAEEALAGWEAGRLLLSPPTVSILEVLRGRPVAELPTRLRPLLQRLGEGVIPPIWFSPGVLMAPLLTEGLPPATHTNAYLVGTGPRYLIDPGAADPAEQERLFEVLEGRPPDAVLLTHHHPDHVGAVSACARRYGVPVLAHPITAERLAGKVAVDRVVPDGERLDLGDLPSGGGRWHLEALHTPGHAPGHLAFYEPTYRLLFVGDLVSTLSSVIVAPPEGDLRAYLDSLRRLLSCPARLLFPAHGGVSARPEFTVAQALAHREAREAQLVRALGPSPRTPGELTREIYPDLPEGLRRWAELQTLGGLEKLAAEGRARRADEGWVVA